MDSFDAKTTGQIYRFKDAGIQVVLTEPYDLNGKVVVKTGQPFIRVGSPLMARINEDGMVKWSGIAYIEMERATHVYHLGPVEDGYRSITPQLVRIIPKKKRARRRKEK